MSARSGHGDGDGRPGRRGRPAGVQGIAAGEYAELVDAIRAGTAYANVHTTAFPVGEIRAQIENGHEGHQH